MPLTLCIVVRFYFELIIVHVRTYEYDSYYIQQQDRDPSLSVFNESAVLRRDD